MKKELTDHLQTIGILIVALIALIGLVRSCFPPAEELNLYGMQLSDANIQKKLDGANKHWKNIDISYNEALDIDLNLIRKCPNLEVLNLSNNNIKTINLTPIEACEKIRKIDLRFNNIHEIILPPLKGITSVSIGGEQNQRSAQLVILLGDNQLNSIDLSPLGNNDVLSQLYFENNKLNSIDLSPLASCSKLKYLSLTSNELQSIDLSPLKACRNLEKLSLAHNRLRSIDLSPLENLTSLSYIELKYNEFDSVSCEHILEFARVNSKVNVNHDCH